MDQKLDKIIRAILITLTALLGISTLWLYIHRTTFEEPLFFIAEILFNIPLMLSAGMFMFMFSFTIGWLLRRK